MAGTAGAVARSISKLGTNEGPNEIAAKSTDQHRSDVERRTGNRTDGPRWAYIVMANPSDARWNGAPPEAYDTAGMHHLQALDDEARFPVIS